MADFFGTPGNDNFEGTPDNDRLFGGTVDESNETDTGDDLLNGLAGDDLIRGGDGDDGLLGGAGIDTIFGEIGNDTIDGGAGNDILNGADGDNQPITSNRILQANVNPFTGADAEANIILRTVENGIEFTVELVDTIADINGVFFNLNDTDLLEADLNVTGEDVTASQFGPEGGVGNIPGANIRPESFDAGIAIGTPGIGENDISSTTFTLEAPEGSNLSIDDFVGRDFGLRLTSVGVNRESSSKLSGTAQESSGDNTEFEDDDVILGQSGNDELNGEEGNDLLDGGAGDDIIDGGSGIDRAGYPGTFDRFELRGNSIIVLNSEDEDAYEITLGSEQDLEITINDRLIDGENFDSGEDTLTNVEFLDFGGLGGEDTGTVEVLALFQDDDINQTPIVSVDTLTVNENETGTIFNTLLRVSDDDDPSEITYTLESVPELGTLFLNTENEGNTELSVEDTFTQEQVNAGLLTYQAPEVDELNGFSFRFTASDPEGETTTDEFRIEVNPLTPLTVNDANFSISPSPESGLEVGTLEFNSENSNNLNFEIQNQEEFNQDGDEELPFVINNQGLISVNDPDDFAPSLQYSSSQNGAGATFEEDFPSFDLVVEASDGTNTVRANVEVEIESSAAFGFGNPRVITLDRNAFDFQAVGEFIFLESTDQGNPLSIQARTAPVRLEDGTDSENSSQYTAVAVEFAGQEIAIYSGEENPVVVNNEETITLAVGDSETVGDSGIEITRPEIQGDDQEGGSDFYQIDLNDQEIMIVQVFENRLDFQVRLSEEREDDVQGVFGNNDGNPNNDLVLEDGTNLDNIEDINQKQNRINSDFADRWRINNPTNSLLVREDENLEDINNLEFPSVAITIDNFQEELGLTDEEVSNIEEQVREAGIPEGPLFDAAVIDFATTNDESFLASAQNVAESNATPTVEDAEFIIGEDLPNDSIVGSVNISDADDNLENLTVTITEGNPDTDDDGEAAFAIDGATGNLRINDSDELAARDSTFTLTVAATDPLGVTDTATVTVTEENAPPVFGEFQTNISLNSEVVESGDSIVTLAVTEPNDNDTLRFQLQGNEDRDNDNVRPFRVNENNQLIINDRGDLTNDLTNDFALTVTVNDGQGGSDTINLDIDVNSAPNFAESQFIFETIDLSGEEPAARGDNVGQVAASEPDEDQVFFEIIGGNDRNNDGVPAFTINQQGQIRINSITEIADVADAGDSYNLRVSASDVGEASAFADVVIPLKSSAENNPPVFPSQDITIPENLTAGEEVGTVFARDPDGDPVTFELADETENFTLNPNSGLITVADGVTEDTLDLETRSGFGLNVTATDSEGNTTNPTRINVNLSDVNDESPVITPPDEPFTVVENAEAGTILGTIEANDPDGLEGEPDELTFSITDGNLDVDGDGNLAFAINDNNGQLEVNDPDDIDFENQTNNFNLEVQVSDEVNDPDSAIVTINVSDQNDPPVITVPDEIDTVRVASAENGDPIFTIEATDEDEGQDAFTFSIIAGNPNTDGDDTPPALAIGETTGAITIADLDDFTGTLRPTIVVEDAAGATTSQQITIPVNTAENDPPVFEEDAFNFEIEENSAATTEVGTVEATDSDPEDTTLTFAFAETSDNFVIDSETGEITVAEGATLDFEGTNPLNLTVTVTDGIIDTPVEAPVTIELTDVNEPPDFETEQALSSIRANAAVGTVVDTVEANDPENDPFTFEITDGNPDGDGDETPALGINNAGRVTVTDADDLIAGQNIELAVQISQEGEVQGTITATIAIGEPDNDPPVIEDQSFTVDENSDVGTEIGTVQATDSQGDEFTFDFDQENLPTDVDEDGELPFAIADDGLLTVNDSDDLDFDTEPTSFSFGVTATESDGDQLTGTGTVTVNLDDVEEPTFDLDVDENDSLSSLNDGLSILRFTGGLREAGFMAPAGDSELDGADVLANIQAAGDLLDVDENDSLSSLNDGLSILRFTGGLREAGFMAPAGDSELDGADVLTNVQALDTTA